jgi:hypothetical protein
VLWQGRSRAVKILYAPAGVVKEGYLPLRVGQSLRLAELSGRVVYEQLLTVSLPSSVTVTWCSFE